jgi:hypothetical protein
VKQRKEGSVLLMLSEVSVHCRVVAWWSRAAHLMIARKQKEMPMLEGLLLPFYSITHSLWDGPSLT